MNAYSDIETAGAEQVPHSAAGVDEAVPAIARLRGLFFRRPLRSIGLGRLFAGGRVGDAGRLPRYLFIMALGCAAIWFPILSYLNYAPLRYTSKVSLILPGAGASASLNLSGIGQSSSSASSPYSGSSVSPTVTYKRLLEANRVLVDAAARVDLEQQAFGSPRIKLVDETSLILFEMTGQSPTDAQTHAKALLDSFLDELDRLRADELKRRETSARAPIAEYEAEVGRIRGEITRLQLTSGLVSVDHYNDLVAATERLAAQVRDSQAAMRQFAREVEALHAALGIDALTASLTLRLHSDTEYQMLAETMGKYASELAVARGKYGERHPELIAVRDAHSGANARLYQRAMRVTGFSREDLDRWIDMSPGGERGRLLAELVTRTASRDGMAAEYESLNNSLMASQDKVRQLVAPASRLDDLNRDYQIAEAVFSSALARSDTGKSDIYASYPLVQVLEDPSLPQGPSSPKRMMAIAAGLAGCICILMALVLAWVRRPIINRLLHQREAK